VSKDQGSEKVAVELDTSRKKDVTQSHYYQQVQQQLAEKAAQRKAETKPDIQNNAGQNEANLNQGSRNAAPQFSFEDTVDIKSHLSWENDSEGQTTMKADLDDVFASSVATRLNRASFLGYKIDLHAKSSQLLESYIKHFIQAKSHNILYGKLAAFKAGFQLMMLSALGVTVEEIRKMQKKAIADSKVDNIRSFEQNEYNFEMSYILGAGKGEKKAVLALIEETRGNLIAQMRNLGFGDYYSAQTVEEIRLKQCEQITREFRDEYQKLMYQVEYT